MTRHNKSILYCVRVPDPHTHQIHIDLALESSRGPVEVSLPAWIPGSYMIRDFARNIIEISEYSANEWRSPIALDKQTWRCETGIDGLRIRYTVYAKDLSVRGAHVDDEHVYFNGTSVFLRIKGFEHLPHFVELKQPGGVRAGSWRVATTLPPLKANDRGYGVYQAADYESLVDYPVEISDFDELSFDVNRVPHRMTVTGVHRGDLDRIEKDLEKICRVQADTFGEELPISQYLFQVTAVGDGYGGLEHRDSTSLICSRGDLPLPGGKAVSEGYRQFLGLCAHEYFHLWNVKRIRPAGLAGSDLTQEAYTRQLWAFEGFTSYFDDLALVRSGVVEANSYLDLLARNVTKLLRCGGRHRQSIAESSFFAWTKFYKQDENAANAIVSYYTKGALVSLGLDVELRRHSKDRFNLNNLMRVLWQRYGKTDEPVPEGGIEAIASEIAGLDMHRFFDDYVYGTNELPLSEWLGYLGIGLRLRPADNAKDQGGHIESESALPLPKNVIGATFQPEEGCARLASVVEGGAAQQAGLAVGDLLAAVSGIRVKAGELEGQIGEIPDGETVEIHAFRREVLRVFKVTPKPAPADTCDLWLLGDAESTDVVRHRRANWLGPPSRSG